jgi:hypothetical protein
MPKEKSYTLYICRDCEVEFIVGKHSYKGKRCCPVCSDTLFVERIRNMRMERNFHFYRVWTHEEKEIVVSGKKLGLSLRQISESLDGRSKQAVQHILSRIRASGEFEKLNKNI